MIKFNQNIYIKPNPALPLFVKFCFNLKTWRKVKRGWTIIQVTKKGKSQRVRSHGLLKEYKVLSKYNPEFFFRLSFPNCKSCVNNCDYHLSFNYSMGVVGIKGKNIQRNLVLFLINHSWLVSAWLSAKETLSHEGTISTDVQRYFFLAWYLIPFDLYYIFCLIFSQIEC